MITLAVVLLALAIAAAIIGYGGALPEAAMIAQTLFFVFMGLSAILMVIGVMRKPPRV